MTKNWNTLTLKNMQKFKGGVNMESENYYHTEYLYDIDGNEYWYDEEGKRHYTKDEG